MKRNYTLYAIRYTPYLLGLLLLSGCVVRTYPVTRERVDQDLTGNRGYLKGEAPAGEEKERKITRTTQVVEIELHSPIRFEKMPKEKKYGEKREETEERKEDQTLWGNRGYITKTNIPETAESVSLPNVEKYTVQKGDTLQKISKKFYGTTKKWHKIYEANKDRLKAPDKVYPGQVIDVPLSSEQTQPLKEPLENLK
jgi:LysM repeat protein